MRGPSAAAVLDRSRISPRAFARIAQFIEAHAGIKMPDSKKLLVESRLMRCLRASAFDSIDEYCDYILSDAASGADLLELINALTTNKTDFFREPGHFSYITSDILPRFAAEGLTRVRCWSAAASSGMEAYTLAMVLADQAETRGGPDFEILATDIDTNVLAEARRGVYALSSLAPVPPNLRSRYVHRANDPARQEGRITADLRRRIAFARLNLMDSHYPVGAPMDIIMCRNVLIYFDKAVQLQVVGRLCQALRPGGYLLLGHSESIMGLDLPLESVASTVFRRI
jgi:chemotaxis protein methyltransferase CheR